MLKFNHKHWLIALACGIFFVCRAIPAESPRAITSSLNEVRLTGSLAAQSYKVGQPIKTMIKLSNGSTHAITHGVGSETFEYTGFSIKIEDANGKTVALTPLRARIVASGKVGLISGGNMTLEAGQAYEKEVDLAKYFQLIPGSYRVTFGKLFLPLP